MKARAEPSNKPIPQIAPEPEGITKPRSLSEALSWILAGLFAAHGIFVLSYLFSGNIDVLGNWPGGLLLLLATACTLQSLSCELPWQNVLLASAIIGFVSGVGHWISLAVRTKSAPGIYSGEFWPVPLLWLTIMLTARQLSRLVFAHESNSPVHGAKILALSVLLVVLFGFGSQYLSASNSTSFFWPDVSTGLALFQIASTSVVAFILAASSLINKRPVESKVRREPMVVWSLANALCATAVICRGSWFGAIIIAIGNCPLILVLGRNAARAKSKRRTS